MTNSDRDQAKPTAKQLRYLRNLAASRGESFAYPRTRAQASEEIGRLRAGLRTPTADSRRELREVRRALAEGAVGSTRIRPEEIEGYGSNARWR